MNVDIILDRLQKVRKTAQNRWIACCPAHDDKSPSLGVTVFDNDNIGLHCFAGCSTDAIVSSIGLNMSDLFEGSIDKGQDFKLKKRRELLIKELEFENMVLAVARGTRKRGNKLSEDDIKRERQAFIKIKMIEAELKKMPHSDP